MEDQEAIEILSKLTQDESLSENEREAILTAIGILSWSKLYKSRMEKLKKAQQEKRMRDFEF